MIQARLKAHTATIWHTLESVLGVAPFDEVPPEWDEDCIRWQDAARGAIGNSGDDAFWVERLNPNWRYYSSHEKNVTVLEIEPPYMASLRLACRHYAPVTIRQGNSLVLSANGMHHAISISALRRAEQILRAVEGDGSLIVGDGSNRWDSLQIMVVPLENCLVLVGTNFLVATQTLCGYQPYLNARRRWEIKNRDAAAIFGLSGSIEWRDGISAERFADLVHALLKVEPGVSRVRSAGPHNERDQGRDLIVDRATVAVARETAVTKTERVVVQVKTRKTTVGKRDVVDIRDTLGYHKSQSYLLVAYPRLSNDLVKHLEVLGEDGVRVDWWTRSEIEDRLRKHPHIVSQFPDLMVHRAPI